MQYEDRRSLSVRLSVLQYGIASAFAVLAVAFWVFQVAQHRDFAELAENNHLRTLPLRAPRGVLFDRDGKVLVENRYSFTIALVREQTANLDATIRTLSAAIGVPEDGIWEIVRRRRREPSYRPIPIVEDAPLEQVAAVHARKYELPGVIVQPVPTRRYPDDAVAAHLFGYVGEVTESQLKRTEYSTLQSGAIVGQAGIEQAYNAMLMGKDGNRYVVVNSVGREIRMVGEEDPTEGRRLQLTIDYDIQRAVEEGFRESGYNGSAVILNPRNGEVLALVSIPAYDPNRFAVGIDRATWTSLNTDKLHPLQNRAIQGRYSPGSTFKIVMAVTALEEGVITPDFRVTCPGGGYFYGRWFQCHLKRGHGTLDLRHAIEQSCNTYFYTLGSMLKIDQIHKWATRLGIGVKSGIDLPHEIEGIMPSTEWKRKNFNERWYPGETISVAIGQGQVSVTPISLALTISTIANGGTLFKPQLLKAVNDGAGWKLVPPAPPISNAQMKPETVSALHDGLWMVVNAAGTGGRGRIPGRDVAAKTGTAQVISLQGGRAAAGRTEKDLRDHGWFVFFAPRDNPEIAGVVFAEHSEHGYFAAPIAKYAMETYFAKKDGAPLPRWPKPKPAPAQPAPVAVGTP
ncbi:MAG TPA: penicillin-binding protein 2 [Vicinamibacterales bacterium]|nr:penicillin-binding protein 2 [Vicinamibacterales bacterium]